MILKHLVLDKIGPFRHYEIEFPKDDNICVLLTGKNNEGKSTIINALRILDSAARVSKRSAKLSTPQMHKKDTDKLDIGKIIHNYSQETATITGVFYNGSEIEIALDASSNKVSCNSTAHLPQNVASIFGFIPPLGQLAEFERPLDRHHVLDSISTTLAPRHLRNHLYQLLDEEQTSLVRRIVSDSWEHIDLSNCEYDYSENKLFCIYKERGKVREIAWAGQGLQIWFQIITHLVRLHDTSILVLDEPEIFLHTQKQRDLIQILREYYDGSIIIATHSIELMNNVDISHIVNVNKALYKPSVKSTSDRRFLDKVRSQLGSSFNLIASQFEEVDILIFTEDKYDFDVVSDIAKTLGVTKRAFNVPLHGFSEYKKSLFYKEAYEKFFGKRVCYTVLLDRDFYPQEYLDVIKAELEPNGLRVVFTPGKEIENILLDLNVFLKILPTGEHQKFLRFVDCIFEDEYDNCFGSLVNLHTDFPHGKKKTPKTVIAEQRPRFNKQWYDPEKRFAIIDGGNALRLIRRFFQENSKIRPTTRLLIQEVVKSNKSDLQKFITEIYQI